MEIKLQIEGARVYLIGNTYPLKDKIKSAGGHWDGERKAWWVGAAKRAEFEAIASTPAPNAAPKSDTLDRDATLQGKATYKGKTYLLVWEGTTSRGQACKLAFRDGSKVFWADATQVTVLKRYNTGDRAVTIASLEAFAERRKREEAGGACECSCHRHSSCKCGHGFCSFHHDGCDRCGCES